MTAAALDDFSATTREWFSGAFAAPTPAQAEAWKAIARGEHALVIAPTGSGKTLAAFLWALDRLATSTPPTDPRRRCRVVYVSPLKALAVDIERNLRAPLAGMEQTARRLALPVPDITVALRTGDTPASERRRFRNQPPDILITTPESLFLLLTSGARESLRGVETVLVDEVHAVAATKRGAHLALSLERLDALLERPAQRIGLSATVRPAHEMGAFLSGSQPATVIQPPAEKHIELDVVVPVEDMTELGAASADSDDAPIERRRSIWPHVEERLLEAIQAHRSTIVFANSRRLAERLCSKVNELAYQKSSGEQLPENAAPAEIMAQSGAGKGAPAEIVRAHHGSVSKEERAHIEDALKSGRLPAVVATSSLELGIDMGAVDLVAQVESPPSVASGLQRIGRAGHHVGAVSKGMVFPKHRGDLLATAVTAERVVAGEIEAMRFPRNPLDVLAQQIVAMVAMDDCTVDEIETVVRRAAPYGSLPRSALEAVLDMLSGRYPSEEFGELRPRLVWDRVTGTLRARTGAQRLAVTSGGTIPDRGLYGVHLIGGSTSGRGQSRVGELDEEMVYESRVGDVFVLGATSWRIEDITPDRVLVSPAPGQPGRLPFWKGDAPGRPAELGRAIGAFCRELASLDPEAATARARQAGLDEWAAANLVAYLAEQRDMTGYVPDDRTVVVERFRDELGDWRLVVHSLYGARVNAPWALAIARRLTERYGVDAQAIHADDGIVLRIPDTDEPPTGDVAIFDPDEIEQLVIDELGSSAMFAARFRECAGRALLLPRRSREKRMPLWQQRQRAAQLLAVASEYPSFPIVLEAARECLQDVFDTSALVELARDVAARRVRVLDVETPAASPFAAALLFRYVEAFMYSGDAPLAERRAQALALDSALLAELLGEADLRELLDADVLAETERELARLTEDRRVRDEDDLAHLIRTLGPLSSPAAAARGADQQWLASLAKQRRVLAVRIAGEERLAAIEDAGRLRDALGVPLPVGIPQAYLEPVADPLADLVSRYAKWHGPFRADQAAAHYGLGVAVVTEALHRLAATGRVVRGEFRPGGRGEEWCETDVLRLLRRRSLARLRKEVEPVPQQALAGFLPVWHRVGTGRPTGVEALARAVEQLQGAAVPASALETLVLPARVPDYTPALLDELTATGEVLWAGQGSLPGGDGWVALYLADTAPLLLPEPQEITLTPLHDQILDLLSAGGGALFFRQLSDRVGSLDDMALVTTLWDLVWAGRVSNDTLAPLRATLGTGRPAHRSMTGRRGRPVLPSRAGPPTAAGRWWLLPQPSPDPTRRAHALAEALLERHGVVTRGAVAAERLPGGYAGVYPVLRAFEESGRCRRGYFVEGLGAAQFAVGGAVDRMRELASSRERAGAGQASPAVVLAAAEPANPYGAALPWPERPTEGSAHRPGRKAGALVVLVAGRLVLYVERGGRTVLSWSEEPADLQLAADALAVAVRKGALGRLTVERADGTSVTDSALAAALEKAGFRPTPRGLRLRG